MSGQYKLWQFKKHKMRGEGRIKGRKLFYQQSEKKYQKQLEELLLQSVVITVRQGEYILLDIANKEGEKEKKDWQEESQTRLRSSLNQRRAHEAEKTRYQADWILERELYQENSRLNSK